MTAWSLVALGATTTVTSGNISPTLPAGGQKGDLYVAVIAYRDTAAFTAPAGWTIHQQQSTGNVSTTTSTSIGSGLIASIVRGDTDPANTFTRTAGNVGHGAILLYRANNGTPQFMTSSSSTAAANATALSTGALTTTDRDALIVAGFCGADNTTVSAFTSTGATASGATNTTTAPTPAVWLERRDAGTNTGADTAVGIADAVRTVPGSTGTISCTAGVSSRHVMVAAAWYVPKRVMLLT